MNGLPGLELFVPLVQGARDSLTEKRSNRTPRIPRGNGVIFRHAVFITTPGAASLVTDFSGITSITMQMRKSSSVGDAILHKVIEIGDFDDLAMPYADWDGNTGFQLSIPLTGTDTNQDLDGKETLPIYIAWQANRVGADPIFLGATKTTIFEDGVGSSGAPTPGDPTYLTAAESRAEFATTDRLTPEEWEEGTSTAPATPAPADVKTAIDAQVFPAAGKLAASRLPDNIDAVLIPVKGEPDVIDLYIGTEGEFTSDGQRIRLMDGHTPGGIRMARKDEAGEIRSNTLTMIADASDNMKGYGLVTIPDNWQLNVITIKALALGQGVTVVGLEAFRGCTGLVGRLVIPDSVVEIRDGAFSSCPGLTGDLVIPDSVINLGAGVFQNSGFTGVLRLPKETTVIKSLLFNGCAGFTGDLVLPSKTVSIEGNAFTSCSGLNGNLVLPPALTTLGSNVFRFCAGFTGSLLLPAQLTSAPTAVFEGCSGFTGTLTFPPALSTIGGNAFRGCAGFSKLVIPNTVTSISLNAFRDCVGMTSADCYIANSLINGSNKLTGTSISVIHARASDGTWTAGPGQTIGGKADIEVIKDL